MALMQTNTITDTLWMIQELLNGRTWAMLMLLLQVISLFVAHLLLLLLSHILLHHLFHLHLFHHLLLSHMEVEVEQEEVSEVHLGSCVVIISK
jgi:hypothetical protein